MPRRRNNECMQDSRKTTDSRFGPQEPGKSRDPFRPTDPHKRKGIIGKLGSYRAEIFVEIFLVLVCAVLGVALQLKMMLTVTLFCIAAALPDLVTAWIVRRTDPDRKHGKTLMYFFIASGLIRTATLGMITFVCSMLAVVMLPFVMGLADVGAITGLLVTAGVLVVIFPVTLMGVYHGRKLKEGVFFCRELTKIRRKEGDPTDEELHALNPLSSLRILAAGSAISVAVFSLTAVMVCASIVDGWNRQNELAQLIMVGVVIAQMVVPIFWYIYFSVKFVEPWQPDESDENEYIEPLKPGEIQFLND